MASRSSESPYRRQQAILIRKAIPELSVWRRPPVGASPAPRRRADRASSLHTADALDGTLGDLAGIAEQRAVP